jgi:hypothetical protein
MRLGLIAAIAIITRGGAIRKVELWRGKIDPLLYVDGTYRKLADPDGRVST